MEMRKKRDKNEETEVIVVLSDGKTFNYYVGWLQIILMFDPVVLYLGFGPKKASLNSLECLVGS